MAGFLYYLPGVTSHPTLDQLVERGLGYAFEGDRFAGGKPRGPDGGEGYLVADPQRVNLIGYLKDKQRWVQCGDVWVGVYTDAIPGPEDLAREEQLGGHWVKLADGRPWLVPVARSYVEQDGELRWLHALPRSLKRTPDGHWMPGYVLPKYRTLWEVAVRFDDALAAARGEADQNDPRLVVLRFDDMIDAAIQVIAWNYRVGPAEAELLGLFSFDRAGMSLEAWRIMKALIDEETYLAWLKKKATAMSLSDGGGTSTAAGSAA